MRARAILLLLVATWFARAACAVVHYADASCTNPSAPYLTWGTAATDIQSAVDAASDGDTVRVTNGTYALLSPVTVTNAISVASVGGAGRTVIDGCWTTRCVYLGHPSAVLEGFALTGGRAPDACGVFCAAGTVRDCIVAGNSSSQYGGRGGGVLCLGGLVERCLVVSNSAYYGTRGGGVYCAGPGRVSNCTVEANTIEYGDGLGGGVYCASNGVVEDCTIVRNVTRDGGGVYCGPGGVVRRCAVSGNTAHMPLYGGHGGGVYCGGGTIESCVIYSNFAFPGYQNYHGGTSVCGGDGGGVRCASGVVRNCTIVYNQAYTNGGGVCAVGGEIVNSIICLNVGPGAQFNWVVSGAANPFVHCLSSPVPPGPGNLDETLFFAAPGSLRLPIGSPGIDAGTNQDWMAGATDIDGHPRLMNGIVDIGACEFDPHAGPLACSFFGDPRNGRPPLAAVFGAIVAGSNTAGVYYRWDFESDGTWDAEGPGLSVVTGVYVAAGSYAVSLAASNACGEAALAVRDGYILVHPCTLHVAPGGTHVRPFAGWTVAATDIQSAVDAAWDGDTVLVSNGTYSTGVRDAPGAGPTRVVVDRGITVRSVNGPEVTMIACGAGEIMRGLYVGHSNAVVEGLTIAGGDVWASELPYGTQHGGGAVCVGGTIRGCRLVDNRANWGGGAVCGQGGLVEGCTIVSNGAGGGGGVVCESAGRVRGCIVRDNFAWYPGGGLHVTDGTVEACVIENNSAGYGGGVYAYRSTVRRCAIRCNEGYLVGAGVYGGEILLEHCVIACNTQMYPYGYQAQGGGVSCDGSSVIRRCVIEKNVGWDGGGVVLEGTLRDSIVRDNTAWRQGGGVWCITGVVSRCIITGNAAPTGGGVSVRSALMYNCLVHNNLSSGHGGGVACAGAHLVNCTVLQNSAPEGAGVFFEDEGGVARNCILYFNGGFGGDNYARGGSLGLIQHSCASPLPPGPGNIDADPVFVALNGDFHLKAGSPCIDAGTARGAPGWDLDGTPRPVDGDGDGTAHFDMGAYEYASGVTREAAGGAADGIGWPVVAEHDWDGDGQGDSEENTAGTDPLDPRSVFETACARDRGGIVLHWPGADRRTYTVMLSTNLLRGFTVIADGIPAHPPVNCYTDAIERAGFRAYRVGVSGP